MSKKSEWDKVDKVTSILHGMDAVEHKRPRNPNRKHLCPEHHREAIFAAFRHFGMIEG